MLSGVTLLWFVLTFLSVIFVAIDIRSTPESPVLKWAFVLITAYTGPFGAFLYVLGCREPLPGLHERYVAAPWRQTLGSTMHCVAGDGLGILAGAVIASILHFPPAAHITLEYVLGFGFGWTIFQALFMRDMAGGSFRRALAMTFIPEFLSMNLLMAGMLPIMTVMMANLPGSEAPQHHAFWFVMSMALLAGGLTAYPINWWLVVNRLKHGMMTVRRPGDFETANFEHTAGMTHETMATTPVESAKPSRAEVVRMALLSIVLFGIGVGVSFVLPGSH